MRSSRGKTRLAAWLLALLLPLLAQPSTRGQDAPAPTLVYPTACAVGKSGAIYITDPAVPAIFRLERGSLSVVFQGLKEPHTPLCQPKALLVEPSGELLVCDPGTSDVWRLMPPSTGPTPLTGKLMEIWMPGEATKRYHGQFLNPVALALGLDGNPVIADYGKGGIWRIPKEGGEPREIACVPRPRSVAREDDGSFIVLTRGEDELVRVALDGKVTPVVKGRLAPESVASNPLQVAIAPSGYLVSDNYAHTIWRVSREGQVQALVQGDPLKNPSGIALLADGTALVVDPAARALFQVSIEGRITTFHSF